jgi:hypothetical protein
MSKGIRSDLITPEMRATHFWMQVDRGTDDECWPWLGYVEKGYGRAFNGVRMVGAHELALTYWTGEQRHPDLDTCHSCNNPICVNPHHLRFDTRQSNVDDATQSGRHARGETNGHAKLTEDDVLTIRRRAASGALGRTLARDFGVSEPAIVGIVNGNRWKHVGGPIRNRHGNTKHGKYSKS